MFLKAAVKTDTGRKRPNNEDAFYADATRGIFVVADGMGGHQAGEVASRIAIEEIRSYLEPLDSGFSRTDLVKAVEAANAAIYSESQGNPSLDHMGTTVVVAIIEDERLRVAHVGDSRAYLLTRYGLKRITDDHSFVFELVKEGRITEEEARSHPQRSGLLRALGMDPEVEVDSQDLPYNGEPLLLCSDGLTDMLSDSDIEQILLSKPDPREACETLVAKANEFGGRDNITVVSVRAGTDEDQYNQP